MTGIVGTDAERVADAMTLALAREIVPGDVVAVGLGTPLALVAALLARARDSSVHVLVNGAVDPAVDVETALAGVDALGAAAPGFVSMVDTLDMLERQTVTLEILRPAQVDGSAGLNTSRIGPRRTPRVRFPGGLGTADTPRLLPRVVAYHPDHRPRSLPEQVWCRTGDGRPWSLGAYEGRGCATLVTNLAVIRFDPAATVETLLAGASLSEVRQRTGFRLGAADDLPEVVWPTEDERALLDRIDPRRRRHDEVCPRS